MFVRFKYDIKYDMVNKKLKIIMQMENKLNHSFHHNVKVLTDFTPIANMFNNHFTCIGL